MVVYLDKSTSVLLCLETANALKWGVGGGGGGLYIIRVLPTFLYSEKNIKKLYYKIMVQENISE